MFMIGGRHATAETSQDLSRCFRGRVRCDGK